MSSYRGDWLKELGAADPAAALVLDDETRERTWRVVTQAMREPAGSPSSSPASPRRLARRVPVFAFGVLFLIVGVAFASGVFRLGSPAQKVEGFTSPAANSGAIVPGSVKLLALRTPDPQGGPPWGLRTFTTSRGTGCIQVGRVVDGRLGVLGSDGAYGDDGRLHPLPVASTEELTCSALDANGQIFNNISKGNALSNGLVGPQGVPSSEQRELHDVCAAAVATAAEKGAAQGRICPQSEERDLFYGLLGPEATSVTYTLEGKTITLPTSGSEGAYLIVENAPTGFHPNDAYGAGEMGVLPLDGPITEIHYASGAVCHISGRSEPACAPNGIPLGYVPAEATPTAAQAHAAVSSQIVTGSDSRQEAIVSFKAPLAISSARDSYKLRWRKPGVSEPESVNISEANVTAGQELTVHTGALPSGSTTLEVVLQHAAGPALFEGPGTVVVPVGKTTVNVP